MTQKPYQRYKESGIEWIGKVPEHWEVKAIKWESLVQRGASPRPIDDPAYFDDKGEYAWVRILDITATGMYLEETEQRLSELGSSLSVKMEPGSLFLSIAGSVGKPCIAKIKCCIHDGFVHFPRWEGNSQFLYYVFASGEPYKGLGKMGTQLNLNTDTVGSIVIGIPSSAEQQSIASFLDHETSRIDSLIFEKERLISLLQEYRQAMISHAVTKGLNPNVKMKDSGVEWLGEIPEHWEVKKLKNISPHITVGIVVEPSKYYVDNGVPALRSLNISSGSIIKENFVFISNEANETLSKSRLNLGDLVVVRSGQPGTTAVIPKELDGCNCIDLIIIRKPIDVSENYLSLFMNSDLAKLQVTFGIGGAIQQHFNVGMAQNIVIPLPPPSEQTSIASFLKKETFRIDSLISQARKFIDLLKEYRSSLITAAVTGKIDVREVVPSGSEKQEIAHE